jgi:hypothetical protein
LVNIGGHILPTPSPCAPSPTRKLAVSVLAERVSADLRSIYVWRARPVAVGVEDDSVLVALVSWLRHGAWVCCVGGAGREVRHLGSVGVEITWPVRQVGADGRGVVIHGSRICRLSISPTFAAWPTPITAPDLGCYERWRAEVGAVHRVGAVWFGCKPGRSAGISRWRGLLWVGWRAGGVVTELSQVARNVVGRGEIR